MSLCLNIINEIENNQSSLTTPINDKMDALLKKARASELYADSVAQIDFFRSLQIFNEIIKEQPHLPSKEWETSFLLSQLKRLQLTLPDKNIADAITEGDILEVYDLNGIQRFRNFEYFLHSSFSLNELTSRPWNELFIRDEKIISVMQSEILKIFESNGQSPLYLKVPAHHLKEDGGRFFNFKIQFKFGWPLFDEKGNKTSFLVSQSVERMDSKNVIHLI
jgi:hypothetical protein